MLTLNPEPNRKVIYLQTKEYLRQAYRLNELIKSNRQELNELRDMSDCVSGIDYSKEKVSSGSVGDAGFTNVVGKIIDLEKAIEAEIDELVSLKLEIRKVINKVSNNEERLLLKHRYLNYMTWENICDEMDVSMRTAHRIHSAALAHVKVPEKQNVGIL